jgi:hypothetical protein
MARTVAQIQAQIIAYKNAQSDLAGLNSTSHRAIWLLWTFVTASAIAILEQLIDLYITTIEAIVARSAAASNLWVQYKFFQFQYDATDPQVIQLIDTIPQYPTVDATKRIITACSVTTDINNTVNIKVAKSNPYVALSNPEKSAAQSYIDTIGVAGITYTVISLNADKIYIEADIYYQGQYSAVIQTNVINVLNAYFQQLSLVNFNGSIKMSDLEAVIRNVTGVNDVVLKNVKGRADATAFSFGTYFIQNTAVVNRIWNSTAGYIVQENTSGQTFTNSLNFISQ